MTKIRTTPGTRQWFTHDTLRHVAECEGVREIDDSAAMTIASWWQGPREGKHLATLASGLPVEYDDFLSDWRVAYADASDEIDKRALNMLGTWALDKVAQAEGR